MASEQNSRREGFGGSCALWPLVFHSRFLIAIEHLVGRAAPRAGKTMGRFHAAYDVTKQRRRRQACEGHAETQQILSRFRE